MIGKTILHYKILSELGVGGMGQVYLAEDERTQRKVALKFMGSAQEESARERLTREAQAAARLSHPGIVTLYSLEEANGELFLVQEFVEGETLAKRFSKGALSTQETQRLARELTEALVHAHHQGVLHRDIKPENVLVASDGSYKIADFGIARLEGVAAVTQASSDLIGTLPYMAPERAKGVEGDARADLFSLGAILFEALVGRRAFTGSTQSEVLNKVLHDDPRVPDDLPTGSVALATLIEKLLAKEPKSRPASAEMVLGILQGMESSSTDRITATRQFAAASGGRRNWIYAAAAVVLVVVVGLFFWSRGRPTAAGSGNTSLAVLYFENLADPEDDQKIGAITGNLLITSLARSSDINVMSSQNILDALRQIGEEGTVVNNAVALEVAKKVHAGRIVTGKILQTEPNIVMTAEVSDVRTGQVIAAEQIEGAPGETVFQVVDALSSSLMSELRPASEPTETLARGELSSGDLVAHQQYVEGLEQLAAGDFDAAQKSFSAAVARDPEFAQAHFQLAIVEWWQEQGAEKGKAREALADARRNSDRLTPQESEMVEGIQELIDEEYEAAKVRFDALAKEYPRDKLVAYGQLEGTYHNGQYDAAIEPAQRALEIDPDYTLVASHLVNALQETGRDREAARTIERLLRRTPQNRLLWQQKVGSHIAMGDGDGAVETYHQAIEAGIPKRDIGNGLIQLLINKGDVEGAREWSKLEGETGWRPKAWELNFEYKLALREGRFKDGIEIALRAWDNAPEFMSDPDAPFAIPAADGVAAAAAAGEMELVEAWLDTAVSRILTLQPRAEGLINLNLAGLYYRFGKLDKALKCTKIAEEAPNLSGTATNTIAHSARSIRHAINGEHELAVAELDAGEWVGLAARNATPARMGRMWIYMAAGRHEEALGLVDTLLAAPSCSPDDGARLHFWKAQSLEELGRLDEAAISYREFLRIWKDADAGTFEVKEAQEALSRIEQSTS